jgi:hypothetical protein
VAAALRGLEDLGTLLGGEALAALQGDGGGHADASRPSAMR